MSLFDKGLIQKEIDPWDPWTEGAVLFYMGKLPDYGIRVESLEVIDEHFLIDPATGYMYSR